jgi:endonuclease YncB( thermonuclease family)
MRNVVGGDLPARIWNDFVTQAMAMRAKLVREEAQTVGVGRSNEERLPADASSGIVRGIARVQNTGALEIQGRTLRLVGVDGTGGRSAKEFRRYLGRREVACEPVGNAEVYQCRAGDQDLSRVVLFNGGGRASANASAELRRMEELARSMHTGIWGGRDDDDDD